ncbi:MAG: ATP-binding cassette domain-containing protein [Clostridia bacterium]|nr:ATP-binding cassette domain-containing protein [Clostridia bacterium]
MIRLEDLTKSYDRPVLRGVTFDLPETGAILIRGGSGSGKTTLLRILAGLEKPDGGRVEGMAGKKISFAFQEPRLLPFLTVLDNLLLVREKKDEDRAAALALLSRFGLTEAAAQKPDTLSGGEKCRAALARSLYYGGDVYLWDEPTRELDEENRRLVQAALDEVKRSALVIVSTHDPALSGDGEITL